MALQRLSRHDGYELSRMVSVYEEQLGVELTAQQINEEAVRRMQAAYAESLPLIPGAMEAGRALIGEMAAGPGFILQSATD